MSFVPKRLFPVNCSPERIIFLSLWLISGFLSTRGQNYYFDNYGVTDGLAQSTVFAVIQDRNHNLWIGTRGGVSRFDGITFDNYTTEDGLALNGVRTLYEDSFGNIWMGHTGGGITRYSKNAFEKLRLPEDILKTDITSIIEDKQGHMWITTAGSGAACILNPFDNSDSLNIEQYRGSRLSDRIFGSISDRGGLLYFITDIGIITCDPWTKDFEKYHIEGMPLYFQITSMMQDHRGDLWFGTYNGGLYRYNRQHDQFTVYDKRDGLAHNFISTLFEDSRHDVWAGTWGGGITRFSGDELKTYCRENGLQDDEIWCISEDVEGNILIGTNEHGISLFKGEGFVTITEEDGLINKQVWAILQDDRENFWFGTNNGITVYNPEAAAGERFTHFTSEDYSIGDQIRFLRKDKDGHIWIGTDGMGTFQYNTREDRFNYSFLINSYNKQMIVTAMEIDGDNNLWVGTTDGLIFYDIDKREVQFLTQSYGLAGNEISCIYNDSQGLIWVGSTGKGLSRIEGADIRTLSLDDDFTPKCMVEDMKGNLWIGTEGQGVFIYNRDSISGKLTRRKGLLANLITLLDVDDQDNIYIGTNKGLNKFDRRKEEIYTYTEKCGFIGIETKNNASFRDYKGHMWFGTVNGATRYDPYFPKRPDMEPLTHITHLRVNLEDHEMHDGMKLNYKENSIIFDYKSICLTNPDAVKYRIKLEGADIDWLPETEQTSATYPALPPGKYVFMVRARNNQGIWNSTPVDLSFQIRPPFYKTWWFIMISVIMGAAAILIYIKVREQQLVRENRILEEKVRDRTAIVVAQKEELAQKNKDITDSIQYAQRIQFAMLPPDIPFDDTFVLFKPKDIVSGDFYWLLEQDHQEFIAAVDCTGHGVPGAFMSIIGHNGLNKVVKEYGTMKPSEILQQLDHEISKTLHQKSETDIVKDGMDISLVNYHADKGLLEYAGAYNSLYLIRDGTLTETKGNRFSIGRTVDGRVKEFTNHEFKVQKGDTIYLFSDGYADQFGGESGKKFKYKPMKELLLNIRDKSMDEQRSILDHTIEAWKGRFEQVDDILVIGRTY